MAPNTALAFLALGGGLAAAGTEGRRSALVSAAAALAVLPISGSRLFEYFAGVDLGVDRLFFRFPAESLGLAPVGKMAFFTAASFTLAAVALLLVRARHGSFRSGLSKALSASVGMMGLTFALGYAYGSPLMYEGASIPMAFNTAVGFVLLGAGTTILGSLEGIARRRRAHETLHRDREALRARVRERTEALAREVAVRRESEMALRETEARLALLVESVEEYAILMLDPAGRILSWNLGAQRILGYTEDEILGAHFGRFRPDEDDRDERAARELRIARREGRFQEEAWRVRKDGSRFWASVVLSAVRDADGTLTGFAKVTRDISERKRREDEGRRMQRELEDRVRQRTAEIERANRELEATNRELESFSYSVSHDLRAPLRSISGFSQALLEDQAERLDEQGQEHLQRVCAAAERMSLLIDDLLQLSRIGRAALRREPVDISGLAREVAAQLTAAEEGREAEMRIQDGMTASADPGLLRVALENLLGNAWKFTGERPRARIEVGELRTDEDGRAFFVRDNGAGFDMRYADKLFAPFQRLHGTAEFPGTGVGLATVQRIVRRHGGRAWAEGEVGRGATFYFTLAAPSAAPGGTRAEPALEAAGV